MYLFTKTVNLDLFIYRIKENDEIWLAASQKGPSNRWSC